jgi:hypothetical protein
LFDLPVAEIGWKGEQYKIPVTMSLLIKIESRGVSSIHCGIMFNEGKPPTASCATILGVLLRSQGVDVSDEELYHALHYGADDAGADVVLQMAQSAIYAIWPPNTPKPKKKAKG